MPISEIRHVAFWRLQCHFRSGEFADWCLVSVVPKHHLPTTADFFGEKHWERRVDGFFGLLDAWLRFATHRMEFLSVASLAAVVTDAAVELRDPPRQGPAYAIVHVACQSSRPRNVRSSVLEYRSKPPILIVYAESLLGTENRHQAT